MMVIKMLKDPEVKIVRTKRWENFSKDIETTENESHGIARSKKTKKTKKNYQR